MTTKFVNNNVLFNLDKSKYLSVFLVTKIYFISNNIGIITNTNEDNMFSTLNAELYSELSSIGEYISKSLKKLIDLDNENINTKIANIVDTITIVFFFLLMNITHFHNCFSQFQIVLVNI